MTPDTASELATCMHRSGLAVAFGQFAACPECREVSNADLDAEMDYMGRSAQQRYAPAPKPRHRRRLRSRS